MIRFPKALRDKLDERESDFATRHLPDYSYKTDFFSNDYLGFSKSDEIFKQTFELLQQRKIGQNGATGSRLISGNHALYGEAESFIADFHRSPSALLFNSGYDANVGFFGSVPQRADIILYDELCHASIRDGIRLSNAKAIKFGHNDLEELATLILKFQSPNGEIYIATESVFSMDGDSPNLEQLTTLADRHSCLLVIDEAHALGVFGDLGEGLVQVLGLQDRVFARIMTFGKGLGVHGAAVLGSNDLWNYLINFARSFIYTTGLPPHSVASILTAYRHLQGDSSAVKQLRDKILYFNQEKSRLGLKPLFVYGKSAIQSAIIPGNEKVKSVALALQQAGFEVKPILSPTVPKDQERLRICLHSYNSEAEISTVAYNACRNYILMDETFEFVGSFQFSSEAHIYKGMLEAEGIPVYLKDQHIVDSNPLYSQAVGGVKLFVANADAQKARAILKSVPEFSSDDEGMLRKCPNCGAEQIEMVTSVSNKKSLLRFLPAVLLGVLPFVKHSLKCRKCGFIFDDEATN